MEKLKSYVLSNFEGILILLILVSTTLINYFIYAKLAFLNFYYLPILVAGYYLGKRFAVLAAFFTILTVWVFVLTSTEGYKSQAGAFDMYFHLVVWGGFLILSGGIVGHLSEKFRAELTQSKKLREELSKERNLLQDSNEKLNEYSNELEDKVTERTKELARSNEMIESLKSKVEKVLYSVMDATVARLMIEGKLRNEKRRISVLFSDLKGFTAYSDEHPPEKVVAELNLYLEEMEDSLTRYYGHIDKYMGDGIMVEFGAPIGYQLHALMAVLAGISMQNRIKRTHPHWEMRIGVSTGPTVLGLFGSKRRSYSCIGDTANLASRLEGLCEPGGVYIDEETYSDIKPYINASRVSAFFGQRSADTELENEINSLEQEVNKNPKNLEKLFALGQSYFKTKAASLAIECFEKVLQLNADHTEAKLAFADANLKLEEFEKIAIKGKRSRVIVYKVLGIQDPLMNRTKIPECFYNKYGSVSAQIKIPEDLILPIESIDGSIGHGKIVAIIAYAMADRLGMSEKEKDEILIAGFLHDIGNESIPHELLESRRKLSEVEYNHFKKHPVESAKIMKKMGYQLEQTAKMVESHHERYDGTGYPRGLKGDDIPLGGRILAVADAFDAMTSKRLYAETWEYESAIGEIKKDSQNGIYDPQCVEVLSELFEV